MIKIRTTKPAAGMASASVRKYDQELVRYIRYQSPQNGSTELATCHQLFHRSGRLYLAISDDGGSAISSGASTLSLTANVTPTSPDSSMSILKSDATRRVGSNSDQAPCLGSRRMISIR